MLNAIRSDTAPNLLLLEYSSEWAVHNLLLVPRFFFSESVIEKRKALSPHARRAGWVGCNILLNRIPADGRIHMVSGGQAVRPNQVRAEFSRVCGLANIPPTLRGWTLDVLRAVRKLGKEEFSLSELYELEGELKTAHPRNLNVRPKIRQQLQVLRDLGIVFFLKPGRYAIRD
jgi:type II restriction enzyme